MFKQLVFSALLAVSSSLIPQSAAAETTLLNVSYDVTREFYKDFNASFVKYWKEKTGETVAINQSHGGSSKQARSVADRHAVLGCAGWRADHRPSCHERRFLRRAAADL